MGPTQIPLDSVEQAEQTLSDIVSSVWCVVLRWLAVRPLVTTVCAFVIAAVLLLAVALVHFWLARRKGGAPRTPLLLVSWMALAAVYGAGRLADVALARAERPAGLPPLDPAELARSGAVELWLFGGSWTWPILPLADRPAIALALHAVGWVVALVVLFSLVVLLTRHGRLEVSTDRSATPWSFRVTGCSTTRGLDASVRAWLTPFTVLVGLSALVAIVAYLRAGQSVSGIRGCGLRGVVAGVAQIADSVLASEGVPNHAILPAPGSTVLIVLLAVALVAHLVFSPAPLAKKEEAAESEPEVVAERPDALEALRRGLLVVAKEAVIADLKPQAGTEPVTEAWPWSGTAGSSIGAGIVEPPGLAALAGEAGLGIIEPYRTQARIADWLMARLRGEAAAEASDARGTAALPLVASYVLCGPEGSGRATTLLLAATLTCLSGGGYVLVVGRSAERAALLRERWDQALRQCEARWVLGSAVVGDDFRTMLASRRLPNVAFTDVAKLEEELLLGRSAEPFLAGLQLVAVDELNEIVGVREMHLTLAMQRLWLTLDRLRGRPADVTLLASCNVGLCDVEAWSSRVLGRRTAAVPMEGAAALPVVRIRRRDVTGLAPDASWLSIMARACEAADLEPSGLPWHARRCGDGRRALPFVEGELGSLARRRVGAVPDAAIVLLDGRVGELAGELEVTRLAGIRTRFGSAVQIVALPQEEEVTIGSAAPMDMSRATIALDPPTRLRTIHALRTLTDVSVAAHDLRERLLPGAGWGTVEEWLRTGIVEAEGRLVLGPSAIQPLDEPWLERTARSALPELDVDCVGDQFGRLVDVATSKLLMRADAPMAPHFFFPGAVLLLASGAYRVSPHGARDALGDREFGARLQQSPIRSISEQRLRIVESDLWRLASSKRQVGGRTLHCLAGAAPVHLTISAARACSLAGELVEQREILPRVETTWPTRVLLLLASGQGRVSQEIAAPIVAALKIALPSFVRTANPIVGVACFEAGEEQVIGFYDKTPGGNGAAAQIDEDLVPRLLDFAEKLLTDLPAEEQNRLRLLFDETPGSLEQPWALEPALHWLATGVSADAAGAAPSPAATKDEAAELDSSLRGIFPPTATWGAGGLRALRNWVKSFRASIPVLGLHGLKPTEEQLGIIAVHLGAVFCRRPDLSLPPGLRVLVEPGVECHDHPGMACAYVEDRAPHVTVAESALRLGSPPRISRPLLYAAAHVLASLVPWRPSHSLGRVTRAGSDEMELLLHEMARARSTSAFPPGPWEADPRELFAAAVVLFFEQPEILREQHPALYRLVAAEVKDGE